MILKEKYSSLSVSLPQYDCHEVLRQERLLELRDRHLDYLWQRMDSLPSQIRLKSQDIKLLPVNEQLRAEKYVGVQWDIDPAMADVMLSFLQARNTANMPMVPTFQGSTSFQSNVRRQNSAPADVQQPRRPINLKARMRWKKLKLAISFIHIMKLPDGAKGDMCKSVQDDVDFGRLYLMGTNPAFFRKIESIPENFAVSHADVCGYLDRGLTLEQEMSVSWYT